MTLLNIADMLADVIKIEDVFAGNIDGNKNKCIGVYNAKNSSQHKICIGGKANTKTKEKHISVLVHWTDNPSECERQAQNVLNALENIRQYNIDEYNVNWIRCNNPVSVDKDERGICEYVIEVTIYYQYKEEE